MVICYIFVKIRGKKRWCENNNPRPEKELRLRKKKLSRQCFSVCKGMKNANKLLEW